MINNPEFHIKLGENCVSMYSTSLSPPLFTKLLKNIYLMSTTKLTWSRSCRIGLSNSKNSATKPPLRRSSLHIFSMWFTFPERLQLMSISWIIAISGSNRLITCIISSDSVESHFYEMCISAGEKIHSFFLL